MTRARWQAWSERWLRAGLRFYPRDFREDVGGDIVAAYRNECQRAHERGGMRAVLLVWLRAFADALRNGLAERMNPSIAWRRSGDWGRDAQLVTRRLLRSPLFVIPVVGALAVGLGAFATVYAVVDRVLLAPLPYEDADDLHYVWREYGWFDLARGAVSGRDVHELKSQAQVIEEAVAVDRAQVTFGRDATSQPREISVLLTSPGFFDMLRVQPMLGRTFAVNEYGPGAAATVILGHELWQSHFGGEAAVVNREVRINGIPFSVIGVMPKEFRFVVHGSMGPSPDVHAYVPLYENLAESDPNSGNFSGIIRSRPGVSPEALAQAVEAVGARVDKEYMGGRGLRLYPVQMKEDLVARVRPAVLAVGAAGVFLLLVLLVNLATLLLSRAARREREFAVAQALGANRIAVVRATVMEGAALGLLGGAAGVLLAIWATQSLAAIMPMEMPRREDVRVTATIAMAVVSIAVLIGVLAAAVPAFWAARTRAGSLLGAASVRGSAGHGMVQRTMVVVQVALSLMLLSAGGLVGRSFQQLLAAQPGFARDRVLTMRVAVPGGLHDGNIAALHQRIEDAMRGVPGVTHVGATSALPLTGEATQTNGAFPGAPGNNGDPEHDEPVIDVIWARAGYLSTIGARIVEGKELDAHPPEGVHQAIIDQKLAETYFPGRSAIGQTLAVRNTDLTVTGVVEHVRQHDIHRDGYPQVYIPNGLVWKHGTLMWVVRTSRDPDAVYDDVRRALHAADPQLALGETRTLRDIASESVREQQISATMIGGFALAALLLASMGIFGVMAGSVTRRSHEMAIRLALGADHARVQRHVLGEGARLVAVGILIGAPGVYFAARLLRGVLVDVSPYDPVTLTAVVLTLAAVALLACWLPALRVTRIAPAQSLRQG